MPRGRVLLCTISTPDSHPIALPTSGVGLVVTVSDADIVVRDQCMLQILRFSPSDAVGLPTPITPGMQVSYQHIVDPDAGRTDRITDVRPITDPVAIARGPAPYAVYQLSGYVSRHRSNGGFITITDAPDHVKNNAYYDDSDVTGTTPMPLFQNVTCAVSLDPVRDVIM